MSNARQLECEAADWLARRDGAAWSAEQQSEFQSWLETSYAHKAAYWRLEEGWRRADRVAALGHDELQLGRARWAARAWKPVAMAASLALVAWAGISNLPVEPPAPRGEQVATVTGGHKLVELADGSRIELNTATLLRASITQQRREVWLDHGEAFFDVRHSAIKPFVVHAGPKTIMVMGTKFSVRLDHDKVTVAVLEGRVRVIEAAQPAKDPMVVTGGSIAVSEPRAALVTANAPQAVQSELAWRDGQLVFKNDTLADVAAEFNRYNDRKIVVSGEAAQLKIGGSFKASNVDGFARLLQDAYGLDVTTTSSEVRVTD